MKHRSLAWLLTLALLCSLFRTPVSGAEPGPSVHPDRVIPALKAFFIGTEGNYGSVNPNDNGALSVGILQWHGVRALKLLRRILTEDPAAASCLSAALCTEIRSTSSNWNSRTLTAAEKTAISNLLASASGRRVQDAQAWEDLYTYIELAWDAGMRCDAVVFYYASICNQFGTGGAQTYLRHIRATLGVDSDYLFWDLDELHTAVHNTQSYGQRYLALRDKAYQFICGLGWPLTESDTPPAPDPAPGLQDLPPEGSWARPGIDFVLDRELMAGVSDTAFAPKKLLTRAMAVTILYRMAGCPEAAAESDFSDVDPHAWYAQSVSWAREAGVAAGVSEDRFAPRATVTRVQLAVLFFRYAERLGAVIPGGTDPDQIAACLAGFADGETVPAYGQAAMAWAVSQQILAGFPCQDGLLLKPESAATREQVAALLMRFVLLTEQYAEPADCRRCIRPWPAPGTSPLWP